MEQTVPPRWTNAGAAWWRPDRCGRVPAVHIWMPPRSWCHRGTWATISRVHPVFPFLFLVSSRRVQQRSSVAARPVFAMQLMKKSSPPMLFSIWLATHLQVCWSNRAGPSTCGKLQMTNTRDVPLLVLGERVNSSRSPKSRSLSHVVQGPDRAPFAWRPSWLAETSRFWSLTCLTSMVGG